MRDVETARDDVDVDEDGIMLNQGGITQKRSDKSDSPLLHNTNMDQA